MDRTIGTHFGLLHRRPLQAGLPDFAAAFGDPDSLVELLDYLHDGVYLVDRRRTIRFWNRACEQITGYHAGEVIGRRCFDNVLRHVDDNAVASCARFHS